MKKPSERRLLARIARRIYQRHTDPRRCGYQPFGFDMATFYATRPVMAALYMRAVRRIKELDKAGA